MLSVMQMRLSCEIPVVGQELTARVLLRRSDNNIFTEDVPESAPVDRHFVRYKWYRIQSNENVAVCSVHPSKLAKLQCTGCVKVNIPVARSYHCSTECFSAAWPHHRDLHSLVANANAPLYPAADTQGPGGETLFEVGHSKTYTPTADDIGSVLKFECVVVDAETKQPVGAVNTLLTSPVIPAPSPSLR